MMQPLWFEMAKVIFFNCWKPLLVFYGLFQTWSKQMVNLNERNCAYCSNVFSLVYTDRFGYMSILDTTHCSKSCAVKHSRGIDKDTLESKALDFIRGKNEYCTSQEVYKGTGHSSKTFTQHGVKVAPLNEALGFVKPRFIVQGKVGEFLKEEFPNLETEKKFEGLVSNAGHPLRVDFFVPETNTVIEVDGDQHNNPEHPWRKSKNSTIVEHDKIKNQYFKEKGINIVRIPYKRNIDKDDILSRLD